MTLRLSLLATSDAVAPARLVRPVDAFRGWAGVRGPGVACERASHELGLASPAEVVEALRDWDLGRWTGVGWDDLARAEPEHVQQWLTDETFDAHGGESLAGLLARTRDWLLGELGHRRGRVVAVVPIALARAAACTTLGLAAQGFWRLDVEPRAVVELTLRPGRHAVRWSAP